MKRCARPGEKGAVLLTLLLLAWAVVFHLHATAAWGYSEIHFGGITGRDPPAGLLLIDPLGRRSGLDPKTGDEFNDIPGGGVPLEWAIAEPWTRIIEGGTGDLLEGVYELRLTGTTGGDFYLGFHAGGRKEVTTLLVDFQGWIPAGSVYRYTLVNSKDNLEFRFDTFRFGGFLSPLEPKDPKVFRVGDTIPVKFGLKDSAERAAPNVLAKLSVRPFRDGDGKKLAASPEGRLVASPGGADRIRYDPKTDLYSFDLRTDPFSPGRWELVLTLMDGSRHIVSFDLRQGEIQPPAREGVGEKRPVPSEREN